MAYVTTMSKDWSGGSTRAWRKIRAYVLERDRYICQLQIEGICEYKATHAHHLYGKKLGDDPQYIVAACEACNLHIGNPLKKDPAPKVSTIW